MIGSMRRLFLPFLGLFLCVIVQAEDLPEGAGKQTFEKVCGGCHEAGLVSTYRQSRDDWQSVIEEMEGRGALGSKDEFKQIGSYLARYFGPEVNVNQAAAKELSEQLEITSAEAESLVKYRQAQGNFKTVNDLKKVSGLDFKKIEPLKQRIVF
jgi:competence protein ComEA